MKSKVSPIAAIAIVAVLVLVIGVFAWKQFSGGSPAGQEEKPPGMPADVAAEFQKRMGTTTPTGSGTSGSNVAPPPGAPGGYIVPPSNSGTR